MPGVSSGSTCHLIGSLSGPCSIAVGKGLASGRLAELSEAPGHLDNLKRRLRELADGGSGRFSLGQRQAIPVHGRPILVDVLLRSVDAEFWRPDLAG